MVLFSFFNYNYILFQPLKMSGLKFSKKKKKNKGNKQLECHGCIVNVIEKHYYQSFVIVST